MCGGGGYKGPSAAEIVAQEEAARKRAEAEIKRLEKEREIEKERENAKLVSEQAAQANKDAERRARNRTLLAGIEDEEEGFELENPSSQSSAKRKRATLLSSFGA